MGDTSKTTKIGLNPLLNSKKSFYKYAIQD